MSEYNMHYTDQILAYFVSVLLIALSVTQMELVVHCVLGFPGVVYICIKIYKELKK